MSQSSLNFFYPYEGATAGHENQLTRALLVVLRYSPIAHQAWLKMIDSGLELQSVGQAAFQTQRAHLPTGVTPVVEGESVPGISVWLAPDAQRVYAEVEESDRQQVLDGIISYGDDLVVVIENKISSTATTIQPHQINLGGASVSFDKKVRSVSWQVLLANFMALIERGLVSGAERLLLIDFLDLVEDRFSHIGPYTTLDRCGGHRLRIDRRLDIVLDHVVGTREGKRACWRNLEWARKLAMVQLISMPDLSTVCLNMYPGDTLGQARAFYSDESAVNATLALQKQGWNIRPNFHWGFTQTGYAWTTTPMSVEKYCEYWMRNIESTHEVKRLEWDRYWKTLEDSEILEASAKAAFDSDFTDSKRNKVHPRPGLECVFKWSIGEAKALDRSGDLILAIRERIDQMLGALGEPTIPFQD